MCRAISCRRGLLHRSNLQKPLRCPCLLHHEKGGEHELYLLGHTVAACLVASRAHSVGLRSTAGAPIPEEDTNREDTWAGIPAAVRKVPIAHRTEAFQEDTHQKDRDLAGTQEDTPLFLYPILVAVAAAPVVVVAVLLQALLVAEGRLRLLAVEPPWLHPRLSSPRPVGLGAIVCLHLTILRS